MRSSANKRKKKPATPTTAPKKRGRPAPKMGRPVTITVAVAETIGRNVARGMTVEQACIFARVKPDSYDHAVQQRPAIFTAHQKAFTTFIDRALADIRAGKKGWQGAAWILERRHGVQFRLQQRVELDGKLEACGISEDDWKRLRRAAQEWTRGEAERRRAEEMAGGAH